MSTINKIMVPVDFEHTSALALIYARELSSRFDASLYVVHVIDDDEAMRLPFPHGAHLR